MDLVSQLSGQFQDSVAKLNAGAYLTQGDSAIPPEMMEKFGSVMEGGKTTFTPRDLFTKYYGSKEELDKQLSFAKEAYEADKRIVNQRNIGKSQNDKEYQAPLFMLYSKMDEPIELNVDKSFDNENEAKKKINLTTVSYNKIFNKMLQENLQDPAVENLTKANRYMPSDYSWRVSNPISSWLDSLEHEGTHSVTDRGLLKYDYDPSKEGHTHMTIAGELADSLSRIQRETFSRTGKRFSRSEFQDYLDSQKDLPEEERFQDYGRDTRRGLREILDSYIGKKKEELYQDARKAIPFFVKNQQILSTDYENS
jgi:hypothetical protein